MKAEGRHELKESDCMIGGSVKKGWEIFVRRRKTRSSVLVELIKFRWGGVC